MSLFDALARLPISKREPGLLERAMREDLPCFSSERIAGDVAGGG